MGAKNVLHLHVWSLGAGNTEEDIDYVLCSLEETLRETRSIIRFVSCR